MSTASGSADPLPASEVSQRVFPDARAVRLASRQATFRSPTAGLCPEYVQANLLILPQRFADDFRGLCQRNPVSCPLLGENVAPGDSSIAPALAMDGDVTTDAPGYNVYKDGLLIAEDVPDCKDFWATDSVAFLIGCSFTFEMALLQAGLPPRQITHRSNVSMYKTSVPLCPSGIFSGNMVVSMRPYHPNEVERVRDVTRPYYQTHGEPVAWGSDSARQLGIPNLLKPDFGDPPVFREGEVPVFWGCGVTPQLSVMSSPLVKGVCIGHGPGKMVCLDLLVKDLLGEAWKEAAVS